MVVVLVAILFATFFVVDLVLERRRRSELVLEGEQLHRNLEEAGPVWVAGYRLPPSLHYHPSHTWVHWVTPDQAYVGVDDFARKLLGKSSVVRPPSVGAFVRQGEPACKVEHDGAKTRLLSPLSGEVVAVNRGLKHEPDLVHQDSYCRGWLYKVRSPRLFQELNNLLHGRIAKGWMEDTRECLQHRLMLASGSVIQDGGQTVEDLAEALDPEDWKSLVEEFLLLKTGMPAPGHEPSRR